MVHEPWYEKVRVLSIVSAFGGLAFLGVSFEAVLSAPVQSSRCHQADHRSFLPHCWSW